MLDVLIHSDIGEVVAVVTRYFGGTKLGKGGLVRAYGGCVQHALESLPTVLRIERVALALTVAYSDIDAARKAIADNDAEITAEAYATDVSYTVNVMKRSVDAFLKAIADATSGRARIGPVP
jgi:putative IMPACT (imprinted ancient) family translation regulator